MHEIIEKKLNIENMIYEIRGKQVMLDRDLTKLYNCKNGTKAINLAVKRNTERFPSNFYFQLTNEEFKKCGFKMKPQIIKCLGLYLMFLQNKVLQC